MNCISLFSGIGCGEVALEARGIGTVLMAEADPIARGVLQHNNPDIPVLEGVCDVTAAGARSVGFAGSDGGVVMAGWPCQDLSTAGNQAGLTAGSGTRSALWWDVVRILDETCSEWFIGENVPGLLTCRGGRDMEAVIRSLVEVGYGVCWRMLDAQFFGVPQRRRRLFFVARRAGDARRPEQVLLESEGVRDDPEQIDKEGQVASARPVGRPDESIRTWVKRRNSINRNDYEAWEQRDIGRTLNTFDNISESRSTMLVTDGAGTVRRLMPIECERMMGLPDDHTRWRVSHKTGLVMEQSDTTRYRQIGNGIAVPCIGWIADGILSLNGGSER